MSTAVQYRRLSDFEVEDASALALRVFDEFVATQFSDEGQQEFHRYASPNAIRERNRAGCLTFAAQRDGRLVGMLHLRDGEHIAMLFVERDSQRQGIGRSLIGAATEYVRARQPPVRVLTVASTPNAIEAYRKLGFVSVGSEQVLKGIRFVSMMREIGASRPPRP